MQEQGKTGRNNASRQVQVISRHIQRDACLSRALDTMLRSSVVGVSGGQ